MTNLRYAIRQLRKAPVFSTVAILTLALGIGANTGIFTLLDQALLRTLPISHPEQLVRLRYSGARLGSINYYGGDQYDYFSYPSYRELRDKSAVFSGVLANSEAQVGVQWNNHPELADGELVSGNYFDVLGVRSAIGRLLVPADDVPNGNAVTVLSFRYWKERFNSDPSVIGKALMVNGHPFTIVGVAPPGFRSVITGYSPKLFFPLATNSLVNPVGYDLNDIRLSFLTIEARLKPGETRAHAEAAIDPLWRAIRAEQLKQVSDAERMTRRSLQADSRLMLVNNERGFSPLRDQIRTPLLIVMGMVVLVLLMACVNVSSLLLVRAAGRVREMSVRYALGATRRQIVQQLLTEGLLLGAAGSILGLMLAPAVTSALARHFVGDPTADLPFSTQPDHRILIFNFGVALIAALLFSMAPALRFLHPDLIGSLKQQIQTSSGGPLRFRRLSVAVQIGLSLLLLIGAALFVRTIRNLRDVNLGFATDHLLSFGIDPQLSGYKPDRVLAVDQRILQTLQSLPGTRAVAGTTDPELMGMESMTGVTIAGSSSSQPIIVEGPWVTPGYFSTTGIPLLAGRDFTDQDGPDKPKVVIVNARFAKLHFGTPQNAIGKLLEHGNNAGKSDLEIVGVVGDSRHADLRTEVRETMYRAVYQQDGGFGLEFYVRTWQSPDAAKSTIRTAMRQIDPNLVVDTLRTMDEQVAVSMANDRLVAALAVTFGALAILMAGIGLYGVLAYATAQRTREIGIRMALGARRSAVVRLILADVGWLAGMSILVTLPISFLLSRAVQSQLYNVSPADPLVIACGIVMVGMVVIAASLLPARRAARIEPMQALRTE